MPERETAHARRKRREAMWAEHVAEHGDRCQLCGRPAKTRRLHEDHDHKTDAHRGWLCHRCNRALPNWVTPAWLIVAAVYLAWGPADAAEMRASVLTERGQDPGGAL